VTHCTLPKIEPVIIQDSREQRPLVPAGFRVIVKKLDFGDYGVEGFSDLDNPKIVFERKTLSDLLGSISGDRSRFLRECHGLARFEYAALLIEGKQEDVEAGRYRSSMTPAAVLGTLAAMTIRYGVHLCWCRDHAGAEETLSRLVRIFCRSIEKDFRMLTATAAAGAEVETCGIN